MNLIVKCYQNIFERNLFRFGKTCRRVFMTFLKLFLGKPFLKALHYVSALITQNGRCKATIIFAIHKPSNHLIQVHL